MKDRRIFWAGYRKKNEMTNGKEMIIPDGFYDRGTRARFFEAIGTRRSVRAYAGAPDEKQRKSLETFCVSHSFPGVRVEFAPCDDDLFFSAPVVGSVIGCRLCAVLIIDRSAPRSRLYAGIVGEALTLEAVCLGLGACWVAGSFHRGRLHVQTEKTEQIVSVIALGPAAEENTAPRRRRKLTDLCRGDPASWPLWAYHAAECVRSAPSALNRQPWRMAYAGRTLILMSVPAADDLSMGIALLHLTLGLREKEHQMTFGTGREVAALIAEDRV